MDVLAPLLVIALLAWVLLNRHQLQRVVSGGDDARQHVIGELPPAADFFFGLGHSGMSFIDERGLPAASKFRVPPCVGPFGAPDLGIEDEGLRVLNHAPGIGRNSVPLPARPAEPIQNVRTSREQLPLLLSYLLRARMSFLF